MSKILTCLEVEQLLRDDMSKMSLQEIFIFATTEMNLDISNKLLTRSEVEDLCVAVELRCFTH